MGEESRRRRVLWGCAALLVAGFLWIPSLHLFFRVDAAPLLGNPGISPLARELAARHLDLWTNPSERERELGGMRKSNAEWDFMGRTFFVLALANMALRDGAMKPRALEVIDQILEETLRLEALHGFYHFSMDYARARPYARQPARSQFVDSEIALMLAARRLVGEKESWKAALRDRVGFIVEGMTGRPVLSAESYPDECWTFDNANALASLRMADALDGTDHRPLCRAWVQSAKEHLIHPKTGILASEYTLAGSTLDGPEGSSIWMVSHALQLVDGEFARDQYARARKELRRRICGFDVSREWPVSARGEVDIDSGLVIPVIDASPGASGLALMGAAAFGDGEFLSGLLGSLEMAAFPSRRGGRLRYHASNQVGDSALLYATVLGPLWDEVKRRNGT
jgi:hypothetical protein